MTFTESQLSLLGEFRQLAELEAKATPGRWKWEVCSNGYVTFGRADDSFHFDGHVMGAHKCADCERDKTRCLNPTDDNAALIVAARNQTLALLKRVVELGEREQLLREALREIGECAVVDWQDKLVGLVDAALKNDSGAMKYWSSARQWKQRAEAAEEQKARLERALRNAETELRKWMHPMWPGFQEIKTALAGAALSPAGEE